VKSTKKDKKDKKDKAPRALSAYMLYCKDARPAVVKAHKDAAPTEIVKIIAEQWKALAEKDKKKYNELHDKEAAKIAKQPKKAPASPKKAAPKKAAAPKAKASPKKAAPKAKTPKSPAKAAKTSKK